MSFFFAVHFYLFQQEHSESRTRRFHIFNPGKEHPQSSISAASSLPPFPHHMINPVLQKLGERSQRYAAWIPGKTGNIVLTKPRTPTSIFHCGCHEATENIVCSGYIYEYRIMGVYPFTTQQMQPAV